MTKMQREYFADVQTPKNNKDYGEDPSAVSKEFENYEKHQAERKDKKEQAKHDYFIWLYKALPYVTILLVILFLAVIFVILL